MYSVKLAHHRADIKVQSSGVTNRCDCKLRRDPVDGILPVRGGGGTPLILKALGG